jgi:hypothetical protein
MKNIDLVKHIETNYDVQSIKYKNLSLWLELRNRFFIKLFLGQESLLKISKQTYLNVLRSSFYGFFNWFKKYDAWFLSTNINRVLVDGKYFDRLFDYPASKIDKSLFIELSTTTHYQRKKVTSKNIVSRSPLILLEKLISFFIKVSKAELAVFEKICSDYDVKINTSYVVKKMVSQYRVMKFLLFFKSPEVVFISPSYMTYGYVKALKEKKIKVVEVQHGVILKEHQGYNINSEFDSDYFVDYLLVFGNNEKNVFGGDNLGINKENVIPVGSYYLDHIKQMFTPNSEIENLRIGFTKTFCVSLQELEVGEKLIPLIIESAKGNTNCLFLLKPRKLPLSYYKNKYTYPKNVIFIDSVNVYQLILQSDFHITIYSTCALEAPSLGKRNILFNIDNKSKEYLGESLTNDTTSLYVNTLEEFNALVRSIEKSSSKDILQAHKDVLFANYTTNMDSFIQNVL